MQRKAFCIYALAAILLSAFAAPALAQHRVNVLQDCWTTDLDGNNLELEDFRFRISDNDNITFVWKQKLLLACSNYIFTLVGFDCVDGKPFVGEVRFSYTDTIGPLTPDPANPEMLLSFTVPAADIGVGTYDWVLFAECNDSGNGLSEDGDIDDQCGINVGIPPVVVGPLIYGPEPVEIFDADPGGSPPGRRPGEEGTTRPWCFEIVQGSVPPHGSEPPGLD